MDTTQKWLIAGRSGSGKTSLIRTLAAERDRIIHWDVEHEYPGDHMALSDIPAISERRAFRACYRPRYARTPEELVREFEAFAMLLLKYGRRLTITIDEALSVLPRNGASGGLGQLLFQGRKRGLSVYYATQEIAGLPRALTGQANRMYLFNLDSGGDRMVLGRYLTPAMVQRVAALPPHEYLVLDK